ncbi:hypothetical protein AMJ71_03295 [candidate division TA06 bacterium SM1_40]|uniref:Uncharacterized protein n=1 Tax=candidate division TA06 bacterium SM1_40 TaxID=1703773 RepID=A0A0S8JLC3_UNCT6|nr:MAG: hypothetical protein AMJ71_03295 [candidate division TA06 bacterium SM1_40]
MPGAREKVDIRPAPLYRQDETGEAVEPEQQDETGDGEDGRRFIRAFKNAGCEYLRICSELTCRIGPSRCSL